jgi:hypothetical protein
MDWTELEGCDLAGSDLAGSEVAGSSSNSCTHGAICPSTPAPTVPYVLQLLHPPCKSNEKYFTISGSFLFLD